MSARFLSMRPFPIERLLVLGALAAFTGSVSIHGFGVFAGMQAGEEDARLPPMTGTFEQSAVGDLAIGADQAWLPPPAQSRGRDWIYDVFTPPEIHFQAGSNELFVRPPAGLAAVRPEEPFGVDVLSIEPDVYRLRLLGCVGGAGQLQGAFEDSSTGEVVLAAAPGALARFAAEVLRIEQSAVSFGTEGDSVVVLRLATATVKDLSTGNLVTLREGMPGAAGTAVATVVATGEPEGRLVRVGDRFQAGEVTFAVEEISMQPGTVTMTRAGPGQARPERRVLAGPVAGVALREERP